MDFTLQKTQMTGYHAILDTNISHEETAEAIVPDACPDILRIIETQAEACLTGKEAQDGRVELTGVLKITVLYVPDGTEGVRRLDLTRPFRCTAEEARAVSGASVMATARVHTADAHCLNPRKVLARVDVELCVTVYIPARESFCTGFSGAEGLGAQQREDTRSSYLPTAIQEKTFTFSDDLPFVSSRPAAEELLRHRMDARCTEAKVIGNKLIFKGLAFLRILYRSAAGALCASNWELPFSQIMEVQGAEEEGDCTVIMSVGECTLSLTADGNGEARAVSVSVELTAQALVREERSVRLLSDAYCTQCPMTVLREPHSFVLREAENSMEQPVREVLETAVAAKTVEDCFVTVGAAHVRREGESSVLAAESVVTILYRGEDNSLYSITRPLPVLCRVALPEGCTCQTRCHCNGEPQAVPTTGGIDVRYTVDFHYLALKEWSAVVLVDAKTEEETKRELGEQPSLILRVVQGECLWDIAKACRATVPDMMLANGLESEELTDGMLLLIPQKK